MMNNRGMMSGGGKQIDPFDNIAGLSSQNKNNAAMQRNQTNNNYRK